MLSREEWVKLDLVGLADLAASRQISRRDILETAIREIERLNPTLNAVIVPVFEEALEGLNEDQSAPRFDGMPYLIKDLYAPVKGLPLSNGSAHFKGTVFDFDSTTIARLRASGFRILGRSASAEMGLSMGTETVTWGITRNPYNLDHGAGGSSGGTAAAVASGMLPAAHGTDSGGSIRIPASFTSLVGLKPSRGLNAFGPHRGDMNFGVTHEHALTRTVRDTAAILDVTAGPNVGAPYFCPKPETPFEELIKKAPRKLKIGFVSTTLDGVAIDADSRQAVLNTAHILESLGHELVEAKPEFDVNLLRDTVIDILIASFASLFPEKPDLSDEGLKGFQRATRQAIRIAHKTSLSDYFRFASILNTEVRRLSNFFASFDILLTAASNGPAPVHGTLSLEENSLEDMMERMFEISPFTIPFNGSGQPAISLPVHQTASGLPIGIQLVAAPAQDGLLLQLARQLEEASDWNTVVDM